MVRSLGSVDLLPVLLYKLAVDSLKVAEGQLGRVGGFTQRQIAHIILDDVAK